MFRNPVFRPQSRAIALEPRILFDGAAAVAVDQQNSPDSAPHAPAPAAEAAPRTLVVIDTRIDNYQALASQAAPGADVVLVGAGQDGLKAISDALAAGGKVASIQILSHGAPGQFTLGNQSVSADNVAALSDTLHAWAPQLTADADILLYGCGVGAGEAGRTLITALAAATGADVAASTNDTGATGAGGDWTLEVSTGAIETGLVAMSYEGLLADAAPTVALSTTAMDSLLGGQFSFTASFTNTSSQVGFAPYIDLILPATGKDGAGAEVDDGITFVSATYLGQTVKSYVLTFDASGNATHPLAKDATGAAVIVNAATYGARAGDQLVVLELPYASVSQGQPAIPVVITAQLSNLADTTGSPDLTIKAYGGFQYGNDSADNPTVDPSLIEAGPHSLVVHPTVVTLTSSVNMPEGETATGPNFEHTITVTATPAPGQTLTDVDVIQTLPNSIRVTAITPGAGGTITSITLANGNIIDTPAGIAAALAGEPYLSSYTVHYATLSAASTSTVSFFVAENDSTGNPVLDPISGDDRTITVGAPTASGEWLPLDTRDQTIPLDPVTGLPLPAVPDTITGTGDLTFFVAKSITLLKSLAIASNVGSAGISPGDTLQYTLEINLSDYFGMGKTLFNVGEFKIDDALGDGQRLVNGTPTLTVYGSGLTFVVPLVATVGSPGTSGTALTFDIAQSLLNDNRIYGGALWGDLSLENLQQGATRAVITYQTTVDQAYTAPYTQSEINEGDAISNSAVVSATLLKNPILVTGGSETDNSAASLTVPTNTIQTSIITVNGAAPSGSVELKPGDVVTFRMSYDLTTGDYESFSLTSYLPLPLFDLGAVGSNFGAWTYGAGNTNPDLVDAVTVNTGNALLFNFGSYVNTGTAGSRVVVDFTLTVGNQPFADQRALTVLAQSDQLTTINHDHLLSSGVVNIASVAEPVLAIKQGVVSVGAGSGGLVTGTTGNWAAAGTGGAPFTGSVTDLTAIDGNVTNIDAGDLVRLATAIENTGGLGAFDVTTTVTLPAGLSFVGGSLASANLKVYRGDGTTLQLGTDYSISGTTITFLDNGGPSLLPGRAGTANDTSGANVIVITYDAVAATTVAASQNFETSAALTNYSSADGGPDFTPVDLTDTATQAIAAPTVIKVFANGTLDDSDSSSLSTSGADLVVGESMLYDIVVTLPEGVTQSLRLDDLIPGGLQFDTSFGTGGYQLITTVAGSAALSADFAGSVTVSGIAATPSGTLGADARLTFSAASANDDNLTTNNSFVIRVRLIAGNVSSNQAGASRSNSVQLVYSDPDGDPAPATPAALDRTVALTGSQPTITVREPTLLLTQTAVTSNGNPGQVDAGDTVTYTITISNGSGSSDFPAYDISFSDALPSELDSIVLQSVVSAGGATASPGDFVFFGRNLTTTAGANIDIPKGGSITLIVTAVANSTVASVFSFTNTPEVQWTSLDGTTSTAQANERTGADGLLNGGSLNDYRQTSPLVIEVVSGSSISHVGGLPDTPAPSPTTEADQTVAVGEIIRYRVAFVLAEGTTTGATIKIALPDGLSFINDPTTTTIGLVANSAIINAADLTTGTDPDVTGTSITNRSQALLAADLSNTMTAVVSSSRINTGNPREIAISLGDLTNNDGDLNREAIYLDFNVRVDNSTAVDTSKSLVTSARFYANGTTFLDKTNQIAENVVEPMVTNLTKTVTTFDPRPSQATGIATVSVDFTNSGDGVGYDFQLTDGGFVSGANYTVTAVIIGGTSYAPGSLPAGVTASTSAAGITVDFDRLAQGTTVRVVYTVEVFNSIAIASTDATLKWSSLPESFTTYAGSTVGSDATASGERDGSGITTAPNTYYRTEGAGLGIIQGTLWDDTATTTTSTTPDGTGLANQTVTLTWAGADGNLATSADNLTFTTTTDASGAYRFGVLPSGNFRIDTPTTVVAYQFPGDTDDAKVRIDSDGAPLATITISGLGEGSTAAANAGYVRVNDAPVNTLPAAPTTLEDTPLAITGISVADVDAGSLPMTVKLSVLHGTLNLNIAGVSIDSGALNSASVTINGSQSALNAALATLVYTPTLNYNGTDTLTIVTNDLGNLGDANGDLLVNSVDALTDTDLLTIHITPVNDAPAAVNDAGSAVEAGGSFNNEAGIPAGGNLLRNDIDVDLNDNPSTEVLSVTLIKLGSGTPDIAVTAGGAAVVGLYGTATVRSTGEAIYVVDENNPAVQALRLNSQTLTETFTYRMSDLGGLTSDATITVTIHGRNDTPVGVDDTGTVYEAGGVNNGTPGGIDSLPNVLNNDTDVDSVANGETKSVTGIRARPEADASGTMTGVPVGSSATVAGTYGLLTMNSDGTYTYLVDQNATAVQQLVVGGTLIEYFSYLVTDAEGLTDIAQIKITIQGANDNPVAIPDTATAVEAGGVNNTTAGTNPSGNVLTNDTDVDSGDTKSVSAITGITVGAVGGNTTGSYGTLVLNADGSYAYTVDNSNAAVQALRLTTDTLADTFTYTVRDTAGATATTTLIVTIQGANDTPVARDNIAVAWPPIVGSPGSGRDPTGNVILGFPNLPGLPRGIDTDVDAGDTMSVTSIRTGPESGSGTAGTVGNVLTGQYGSLTLNADGSYVYQVDFLKTAGLAPTEVVTDTFTYAVTDAGGLTDTAQLVVYIRGRNNPPIAVDVLTTALEAGGIANGSPGVDPTGDALANDIDLEGDPLTVTAVRTGPETGSGPSGTLGTPLRGLYGDLTLNADGTYSYVVDNTLLAVQTLRTSGNTLVDTFTYTESDIYGATDQGQIIVTIQGANDNPVANNDAATAVESGGLANATAGVNPTGNVLSNDTDVDAFGETSAVVTVSGVAAGRGNGPTTGNFGSLTLNADGSYTYTVDNTNPVVEALRLASQTLTDSFTYTMTDATGARSTARLTITIQGVNDNPVASDDAGAATDAAGPPVTTGNVLPNDSDVDGGDSKTVIAVRTGGETGTGSAGSIGNRLQGKYGSLILNADGSWRYEVDTANQDVLNAAGAGKVLSDVFTYTMRDTAGATDQAQLLITLDMMAPYTETGTSPFFSRETESGGRSIPLPNVEPITFIHQVVSAVDRQLRLSNTRNDGSDITQEEMPEIRSLTLGAGLGLVPDQFVGRTVKEVRAISQLDRNEVEARQGVVSLSADGLLADPSVFVPDPRLMIEAAPTPHDRVVLRTSSAPSFREQLKLAAERFRPVTVNSYPARIPGEIHHIS
jgi:large repetitive protein